MFSKNGLASHSREQEVKMGSLAKPWKEGDSQTIILSITQDCNLRCTYCYMTKKNNKHKMPLETARKVVDYVLTNREEFNSSAVIWEFIGGEALLEIDLIDQISDYIKLKMYSLNHSWMDNYVFFMSSNGLLYSSPKVQAYMRKNREHVSIGISVDGNKIKHDLSRVKLDGSGSYDDVMRNVPKWLEQFPGSMTKATFAHADLPYLYDSIISLWENDIKIVAANVVFEDVWEEGDPEIFEEQLIKLADYIIEHRMWDEYSVRFFAPFNGFAYNNAALKMPFCGVGKMLAVDDQGDFFPCVRFIEFCQDDNNKVRTIGNVETGLDKDKIRPFAGLSVENQSPTKCLECEVASGCANCTGNDFNYSTTNTIFERATYVCDMHKANVRANKYFWTKYTEVTGKLSERDKYLQSLLRDGEWVNRAGKFLYFITRDDITPHCSYEVHGEQVMSRTVFEKGLRFCEENNFVPIFLGRIDNLVDEYLACHAGFVLDTSNNGNRTDMDLYDETVEVAGTVRCSNANLKIKKDELKQLYNKVAKLAESYKRINIHISGVDTFASVDIDNYKDQLIQIKDLIIKELRNGHLVEINVLTDILFNNQIIDCKAGTRSLSLSPDGQLFVCPAFYFGEQDAIGAITDEYEHIASSFINQFPFCNTCNAYQCKVCRYVNVTKTGEMNIPPEIQCSLSLIEMDISSNMVEIINTEKLLDNVNDVKPLLWTDPFDNKRFATRISND